MKKKTVKLLVTFFALAVLTIPVAAITASNLTSNTQIIRPLNDYPDIPTKN